LVTMKRVLMFFITHDLSTAVHPKPLDSCFVRFNFGLLFLVPLLFSVIFHASFSGSPEVSLLIWHLMVPDEFRDRAVHNFFLRKFFYFNPPNRKRVTSNGD
jgi:hypothetical protein